MRYCLAALLIVLSPLAGAEEYCLALRGNGELAPAHWGAMANLTEKIGLPRAQAGGSSATITMMLNEAIAANEDIQSSTPELRKKRAALLYKSLEGFLEHLMNTREGLEFLQLYRTAQSAGNRDWLTNLQELLRKAETYEGQALQVYLKQNLYLIKSNYRRGVELGLISEKNYAPLVAALERMDPEDVATARFYAGELLKSIQVLGAFDAQNDANLFFRPGLVDFGRLSEQLGRVAMLYSQGGVWREFLDQCSERTAGLTWTEIKSDHRDCVSRFSKVLETHRPSRDSATFVDRNIGLTITSFPTTSVLVGSGYQEALQALKEYPLKRDPEFGRGFSLSDPDSVRFGYWGDPAVLSELELRLPKDRDEKSRRFLALGQASWRKVLSLSPAEPGLASLQIFKQNNTQMVSAGGWSDLHPIMVLKAAGCERVIYVTRRGGESPFAQGVAKRLFGAAGDELLGKLYDLGNPASSMRQSLDLADAVLCTDWNRFDVKTGVRDLIKDSYRGSPFFVRNPSAFSGNELAPQLNPRDVQPDGRPTYEGCF